VKAKDTSKHKKEDFSYFNEFRKLCVFLDKVNQTDKEKEFESLAQIKMNSYVSLLKRLEINR